MNLPLFLAQKIKSGNSHSFSKFILQLSTFATILSVAVMIIALAVVQGFKDTIKDKTFVFWGHFHVAANNANNNLLITATPFENDTQLVAQIQSLAPVSSVLPYTIGSALVSADQINEGLKVKGVTAPYFSSKTNNAITYKGGTIDYNTPDYARQILLSETTLNNLNKQIGDSVILYLLDPEQANPRVRKLQIAGTYHVGVDEIDKNFALCDSRLLQHLYNWSPQQINGYQISLEDYRLADTVAEQVYLDFLEPPLHTVSITDIYAEIFQWLELQDLNAQIILTIMAFVAVINMITALLIFILERNNMIGVLKTLGMTNGNIQKIFLYHFAWIILKGIVLGTIIGVGLCLLQQHFHLLKIDESVYYMTEVPIKIVPIHIIGVIIGTFIFCILILAIPTWIIKKVNIVKAISFK